MSWLLLCGIVYGSQVFKVHVFSISCFYVDIMISQC